jgi:outer membrane lipopolysaccharide assembly protein LptE/RlpB
VLKEGNVTLEAKSSIATLTHQGRIKENSLTSHVQLTLLDKLIDTYGLPLRKGAISSVLVDGVTDLHGTQMQFSLSAKQLLDTTTDASQNVSKDAFNLDIDHALLSAKYLFDTSVLKGGIEANISTPYTKNAMLDMQFERRDSLQYKGTLDTEKIKDIDPKLAALLKRVSIAFDGNLSAVDATIESHTFVGDFHSKDLQKGLLHLESKEDIALSGIVKLPDALRQTRAKLSADLPVDFNRTLPLHAKVKLLSNVIDMDGDIVYGESLKLRADATIPKTTLLRGFDKSIKFSALSPMKIALELAGEDIDAKLASKSLKIETKYNLKSGATKGDINLAGTHLSVQGASLKKIALTLKSRSIQALLKATNSIYKVDLPDVSGNVALNAEIKDLKSATLSLQSQEILVGGDKKTGTMISNLALTAKGDASGISLAHYKLETQGVKLYATKPSKIV